MRLDVLIAALKRFVEINYAVPPPIVYGTHWPARAGKTASAGGASGHHGAAGVRGQVRATHRTSNLTPRTADSRTVPP